MSDGDGDGRANETALPAVESDVGERADDIVEVSAPTATAARTSKRTLRLTKEPPTVTRARARAPASAALAAAAATFMVSMTLLADGEGGKRGDGGGAAGASGGLFSTRRSVAVSHRRVTHEGGGLDVDILRVREEDGEGKGCV